MESSKPKCTNTLKFLYSYGGKILPRSTDGNLRYSGGHTRILAVDPSISLSELIEKLSELCGSSVNLKCVLPNGDLETLISIKSDEELANIIDEYNRASSSLAHPLKIRAILSSPKSPDKLSTSSSSSSFVTQFSSGSLQSYPGTPQSSPGTPPYSAARPFLRHNCSPVGYTAGVRYGGYCCVGPLGESPRFLCRGPHSNYSCTDAASYRYGGQRITK